MKIRSLHPDFFKDSKVASLTFPARLLFAGLWCHSDDYGRGRYLAKAIEGDVFPLDDVDIGGLLDELVQRSLIRLYQSGQDWYYFIPTWEKYQSPKYRAKSSIPEPTEDETRGHMDPGQSGTILVQSSPDFDPGEGEGEGEGVGEGDIAPAAQNENGRVLTELKDTLVELFGEPAPQNWSLYNRVATWIRNQGGTPEDVRYRAGRILQEWGPKAATVTSLEKYWNRYTAQVGQISDADVEKFAREQKRQQRMLEAAELERRLPG